MKLRQLGFGLIEVMIAMVLGLIVVLGISQIFVSSKQSFLTQNASAQLQEDARYILSRMTQEVRTAGMFGCVDSTQVAGYISDWDRPVRWDSATSTLTVFTSTPASGKGMSSDATWTVVTDCTDAQVHSGNAGPDATKGELALPIRQVEYRYNAASGTLSVQEGGVGGFLPLISGVSNFTASFGLATDATSDYVVGNYSSGVDPDPFLIRSVRISLTLSDADGRSANQSYAVVAALRNRLP